MNEQIHQYNALIEQNLNLLDAALNNLSQSIWKTVDKLEYVLSPNLPADTRVKFEPDNDMCEYANRIYRQRIQVEELCIYIKERIFDRLQA